MAVVSDILSGLSTAIYSAIMLDSSLTQLERDKLEKELTQIQNKYNGRISDLDTAINKMQSVVNRFNISTSASGVIQNIVDKAKRKAEQRLEDLQGDKIRENKAMEKEVAEKNKQISSAGNYTGKALNKLGLTGEKLEELIGKIKPPKLPKLPEVPNVKPGGKESGQVGPTMGPIPGKDEKIDRESKDISRHPTVVGLKGGIN